MYWLLLLLLLVPPRAEASHAPTTLFFIDRLKRFLVGVASHRSIRVSIVDLPGISNALETRELLLRRAQQQ